MWILIPLESGGVTHYLLPSKQYVVGRKNCDILLPSDQSISRAHAHLHASDATLTVKDSSKYGTFVNEERLEGDAMRPLVSGDRVTFGVFHSKFRVEHQGVVVCSSCLDGDGKASLSQALLLLGGRVVNTWTEDCTHLVMPAVKVTIKTICALLCGRPIVKLDYFTEMAKAMQHNQPPPNSESFCPDLDEPTLNSEELDLKERPERKRLFSGKTFVFLSVKQLKRLSAAVAFGGGRSQLLEEGSLPVSLLEVASSCVVDMATGNSQILSPATRKWVDSVGNVLQKKGFRFITESEIGLAAMYVNSDKYCNPSNQMGDSESVHVKPALPTGTLSQSVAVDETVLPAASQNITAYAANTETSQRMERSGPTTVGETPEKKRLKSDSLRGQPSRPNPPSAPERHLQATTCTVTETMRSSLHTTQSTGDGRGNGSMTKSTVAGPQKRSPVKPQSSQKGQSSLTTFFQPVDKKRPRDEDSSPVESQPKRTAPDMPPPHTHKAAKTLASHAQASLTTTTATASSQPPARTQSQRHGSEDDLFPGHSEALSDRLSHPTLQGPLHTRKRRETDGSKAAVAALGMDMEDLESLMSEDMDEVPTRKNKGMEEDRGAKMLGVEMEDLESLMSEDMDEVPKRKEIDEVPSRKRKEREEEQPTERRAASALGMEMEELESIMSEEMDDGGKKPTSGGRDQRSSQIEHSSANKKQATEAQNHTPAQKKPRVVQPAQHSSANQKSSLDPEGGPSTTGNQQSVRDKEVSKPVNGVSSVPEERLRANPKPATVKAEIREAEDDLPRRLVLVEFKSLTVTAPPRTKPPSHNTNGRLNGKNFKRFNKVPVPGAEGLPNIIGGSDLLAHNRGTTAELEEMLRDAVEEQQQSKRDESLGDDLFRYNPKPAKRR